MFLESDCSLSPPLSDGHLSLYLSDRHKHNLRLRVVLYETEDVRLFEVEQGDGTGLAGDVDDIVVVGEAVEARGGAFGVC